MGAHADQGYFVGVTYLFGGNSGVGFTLQATSTRQENTGFAAVGVSYYPFSAKPAFGIPIGVGYQGVGSGLIVNYDLLQKNLSVGGGYSDTKRDIPVPVPVPVPVPAPAPAPAPV